MDSKNNTYLSLLIFYHVNKSKTNKKTPFQMEGWIVNTKSDNFFKGRPFVFNRA